MDTTLYRPVLATRGRDYSPILSDDGRWMAYVSDETGVVEVYVSSFPDPATRRQVSIGGGSEPVWAHSGRELFFKSESGELVAATIVTEPTLAVTNRRILFAYPEDPRSDILPSYDVSGDDSRFIMRRRIGGDDAPGDHIIVENFFEELKAKVGN